MASLSETPLRDRIEKVLDWTIFGVGVVSLGVALTATLLTGGDSVRAGAEPAQPALSASG